MLCSSLAQYPCDMTATYYAGLPSWNKKSSSPFYLLFLETCTHRTQAVSSLGLHENRTTSHQESALVLHKSKDRKPRAVGRRAWVNPGLPWDSDAFSMLPAETLSRQ